MSSRTLSLPTHLVTSTPTDSRETVQLYGFVSVPRNRPVSAAKGSVNRTNERTIERRVPKVRSLSNLKEIKILIYLIWQIKRSEDRSCKTCNLVCPFADFACRFLRNYHITLLSIRNFYSGSTFCIYMENRDQNSLYGAISWWKRRVPRFNDTAYLVSVAYSHYCRESADRTSADSNVPQYPPSIFFYSAWT